MWFNQYIDASINYYSSSFCHLEGLQLQLQTWRLIGACANEEQFSGFSGGQKSKIEGWISSIITGPMLLADPWDRLSFSWRLCKLILISWWPSITTYTVVMSQSTSGTAMYGRVCTVDRIFYYSSSDFNSVIYVVSGY